MICADCEEAKRLMRIDQAYITELLTTLSACSKRLQCEARTKHGFCTRRPWKLRDGRLVCVPHHRAKKVGWA